ncbi:MAG: zinc-binding dehydrogenase [Bacteroidetes bacterium]|nr:zinc-binding dehydrogenase [Bacteroidota bacterium]
MRSLVLHKTDKGKKYSDLFRIEETSLPELSDDEVLVKVHFASLNHRDLWIAEGAYSKIRLPVVLGSDGAGTVHSAGKNVKNFFRDDKVLIYPCRNWGESEDFQDRSFQILGMPDNGTFAEYVRIPQSALYKIPAHLDLSMASAFPLAGLTAFRALYTKAVLKKDDTVLITGSGGGVSALALMFAVASGADVFVTSGSEQKISKAVSLGAKGGVKYNNREWSKELLSLTGNKIDVIIDGTGGKFFSDFIEIGSYGARIVSYGATLGYPDRLDLHKVYWKQLKILGTTMGSAADFRGMLDFISDKKVVPVIDNIYPFDEFCKAFDRMGNSEQFGKIVMKINTGE